MWCWLKTASAGTGVIAVVRCVPCWSARASTTCSPRGLGSSNPINIVHATVAALKGLESPEQVRGARRGLPVEDVAPAAMLASRAGVAR
ncbi:ribosomal S5-like protein [Micromonospora kangleipakensis]|uniref:Ribosomal S5-like protein n=1 Tax=Micromonospora kangleipakensis TaxID=1077942 RepID=A0A4Q8BJE9_9ACTN|nr:ribosomal S5-like protein [Micromonospora kangleipakensis]